MGDYPKTPYSIIVDGYTYTIQEQEKNIFFVTHEILYNQQCSFVTIGIFILSPKKIWRTEGESNINPEHRPCIFHAIESRIA